MKKRVVLLLMAGVLTMSILAGCGQETEEVKEDPEIQADVSEEEAWKQEPMYGQKLTVAYDGGNCCGAPYVAWGLGFMEEEGLDVEILYSGSETDIMNTVATGQAELVINHISAQTVPIVNGLKLTMVYGAHTGCQSLYVLNDSPYETTKDLIGKNVNIAGGYGSSDHNIVLRFMAKDGIATDEYNFKVTEYSATIAALESGELDATLMSDVYAAKFVRDGVLRSIRSITWDDDFKENPCCAVSLNTDFLKNNPITAKKLIRAVAKASAWIEANIEESVELMLEYNMISGDDMELLCDLQDNLDWTVSQENTEETLKSIIKDYKEFGLINDSLEDDEVFEKIWYPILSDEELEEVWEAGRTFQADGWKEK